MGKSEEELGGNKEVFGEIKSEQWRGRSGGGK